MPPSPSFLLCKMEVMTTWWQVRDEAVETEGRAHGRRWRGLDLLEHTSTSVAEMNSFLGPPEQYFCLVFSGITFLP